MVKLLIGVGRLDLAQIQRLGNFIIDHASFRSLSTITTSSTISSRLVTLGIVIRPIIITFLDITTGVTPFLTFQV